jgi:hypothetical protein
LRALFPFPVFAQATYVEVGFKKGGKPPALNVPKAFVDFRDPIVNPTESANPALATPNLTGSATLFTSLKRKLFCFADVLPAGVRHFISVKPKAPELLLDLENLIVRLLGFELLVEVVNNIIPPRANKPTHGAYVSPKSARKNKPQLFRV